MASDEPGATARADDLRELDALERETDRTAIFLRGLTPEDWHLPTRCPPMSVLDLASHTLRAVARVADVLDAGPLEQEAEKDAATYYRFDRDEVSPGVLARAQADAAMHRDGQGLLHAWEALGAIIDRARRAPDVVYPSILGAIRLREYLRTRVVEMTIHHMDLRDALGQPPDPDSAALEVTADVLRQLLGTDLRPAVDDVRFALIGTGRAPLDHAERAALGPLADLFPLLA